MSKWIERLGYIAIFLMPLAAWATFNSFPISTAPISGYPNLPQAYNALNYGWTCNDTDQSTAALALLTTVSNAGGGTIYFPPCASAYRADSQLLIPNDGGSPQPSQVNIRLTGGGGGVIWGNGSTSLGAVVLDLRFHGTGGNAKIETRGLGTLVIDHLTIKDGGSSDATPFVHTTNTTLTVRDNTFIGNGNAGQDAIVMGGTSTSVGSVVNSAFQGYGTIIDGNMFRALNRGVYGRTYVNGVVVSNNAWLAGAGTRAMEFDGTQSNSLAIFGLTVTGNTIEMTGYVYGVVINTAEASLFANNGFYDPTFGTSLCNYDLVVSLWNTFILGYGNTASGQTQFCDPNSTKLDNTIIGQANSVQSLQVPASQTLAASMNVPGGAAPTSPNDGDIWYDASSHTLKMYQNGSTVTFTTH